MRLTDKAIKHADTAGKKRLKLFDGGGLHLMITETGGKYWRFRYRYQGKDCTLSLGCYPHISLRWCFKKYADLDMSIIDIEEDQLKRLEVICQAFRKTTRLSKCSPDTVS